MNESREHTNFDHVAKRELILIRHGQSTANASGVWQGQLDFPLSEEGRRQAAAAGQALKGTRISGVYASPLSRAFETAEKFLALPEEERWTLAGAETDEEILARFEKALSEIRSRHSVDEGAMLVISHGGVMRAFLRDHFGPSVLPDHERAPNASFTRLLYDPAAPDATPQLLELASVSHLSREEARQARTRAE